MKKITLLLLSALAFLQSNAQSLPKVQEKSVRAPANVRIDGKPTEWGDSFQAYNPTTELSYTMANDDKNLYITVQANDSRFYGVTSRIFARGITFTFVDNKVKDNKGISVTWPVKNIPDVRRYMFLENRVNGKKTDVSDSLLKAVNNSLEKRFKFITVSGVKDVDTIPVFNDLGIEAFHKYDQKENYNLELSIPLELIRSQINTANTFTYKMTINGAAVGAQVLGERALASQAAIAKIISSGGGTITMNGQTIRVVSGGGGGSMSAPIAAPSNMQVASAMPSSEPGVLEYQSSTSFTGEYTLAK
ncbi:hypothetical protein GCM10027049_24780 [Mucilaginibacter puniceus]